MKRKPIHRALEVAYRGLHAVHLRTYERYQPVTLDGRRTPGSRECDLRWNAVRTELESKRCRSMVDLGCSEGYYVLQAARLGLRFCLGVDFDLRRLCTCQNQMLLDDVANVGFVNAEIELPFLEALPKFDAVVFLSVLHHIMAAHGPDRAREILRALSRTTEKVMIFEMGQSDEHTESWASRLPDMGAAPHAWIAEMLSGCGFVRVEQVAVAPAYGREIERAIFACVPEPGAGA